jgi:hypothetical protein
MVVYPFDSQVPDEYGPCTLKLLPVAVGIGDGVGTGVGDGVGAGVLVVGACVVEVAAAASFSVAFCSVVPAVLVLVEEVT